MKPTILILSDKSETRGPMLEGWIRYYSKNTVDVTSAGLISGKLNLIAAKAMMEAVIDITKHKPVAVDQVKNKNFDWVITLTEQAQLEAAKLFHESKIVHKSIDYPLNESDEDMEKLKKHRKTVNELEEFAIEFIHTNINSLM